MNKASDRSEDRTCIFHLRKVHQSTKESIPSIFMPKTPATYRFFIAGMSCGPEALHPERVCLILDRNGNPTIVSEILATSGPSTLSELNIMTIVVHNMRDYNITIASCSSVESIISRTYTAKYDST